MKEKKMLNKYWLKWIWINFFFLTHVLFSQTIFAEIETYKTNSFFVQGDIPYEELKQWAFLAEDRRRDIAHDLGFFYVGQWDPLCSLMIVSNRKSFINQSGAPNWARGWSQIQVDKNNEVLRSIWIYPDKEKEREPVLSHEIAHQLFREFLNYSKDIPLWLDEGVAIWAEKETKTSYKRRVYKAVLADKFIPFTKFFNLKGYPTDKMLFYSQSSSIIQFLIQEHGVSEFQRFSRLIRDGENLELALSHVYGSTVSSFEEFQLKWKNWILEERGE